MANTEDIKPAKAKPAAKFDNLSSALKKNLQRRKSIKKKLGKEEIKNIPENKSV
ncbi:MAG TPA: hypothetical protein LFW21_04280 [Rickettsia endosymbiont of Pyrocoelia pectoralis]|nr:hypothetical protein [Rickettsia endosymbiont of Pyrocoelia pectoralis]